MCFSHARACPTCVRSPAHVRAPCKIVFRFRAVEPNHGVRTASAAALDVSANAVAAHGRPANACAVVAAA